MSWLTRVRNSLPFAKKRETPDNLWVKCPRCHDMLFTREYEANLYVCPRCEHHGRIGADARLAQLLDEGFQVLPAPEVREDPLKFRDSKKYTDRLKAGARRQPRTTTPSPPRSARSTGAGAVVGVQDFTFMGGSMGMAVGEAFCAGAQKALAGELRLHRGHRRGRRADAGRHPQPDADAQGDRDDPARSRRPGCPISSCSPTRPPAASPPATRCSATSTSPSPAR